MFIKTDNRVASTVGACLGLALLGSLMSSNTYAQNAASQDNDSIFSLDEISVYALRGETDAFGVPGQVSVINRNAINDLNPTSAADIFRGVPGVSFTGGPRRAGQVPSIRGFDGDSVLILFDDARQSFVSGHDGRFFIDPDVLKKVEVSKGPSSALYGSGTIGGVIAFQTVDAADFLKPGENQGVRIKFGYQTVDDEVSTSVTGFQKTDNGGFDMVVHYTFRDAGDIELGSGFLLPSDDQIRSGLLKGKAKVGKDTTVTASWLYTDLQGRDPQNPQGVNIASRSNPLVDRDTTSSTLQAKIEHKPNDPLFDFKLSAYLTNNEVHEPEVDSDRVTSREVETIGFNLQNKSKFDLSKNTNLLFTYGIEAYRDDQTGTDNTSADGTRGGVPNAEAKFFGTYVQAEVLFDNAVLPGKLKFIPGVRFDSFTAESDDIDPTSIDETAVSPKLGISYEPTKWLLLFGNYGEAFRAPTFNEAYATGVHFPLIRNGQIVGVNKFIPNASLQPEESEGFEIGAGLNFSDVLIKSDKFKIKGSYWKSDVQNLIDLEVTAFTSQNVNVTNAELDGFEIEANYDSPFLYARATYSQIDGKDTDTGEFLGILQADQVYIDAGVKLASYNARLGARATFAAEFDKVNSPSEIRSSFQTYDFYGVWQPASGTLRGVRVDLALENAFDEDYEIVEAGVSEPGRNFKAGISYKIPLCGTKKCQ